MIFPLICICLAILNLFIVNRYIIRLTVYIKNKGYFSESKKSRNIRIFLKQILLYCSIVSIILFVSNITTVG